MLTFDFHPEARTELLEAVDYYESIRTGLGAEFLEFVVEAVESICSMPMAYPVMGRGLRRFLVRRFPYAVIYSVHEHSVRIWAVMHMKRRPGYWKRRLAHGR